MSEKKLDKKESVEKMYIRHKNNIQQILSYKKDLRRYYGNRGGKLIANTFSITSKHLDASLRNEKVKVEDKEVSCIEQTTNLLLDVVMTKPINKFVRDISIELSRLIYNWSKSVGNSIDIERKTQMIIRILTVQKTLDDTIAIAQKLLVRLRNESSRRPVSYELAKHYLDSLP